MKQCKKDNMEKINVFITDDHAIFRPGVAGTFQENPQFQIIGEAESAQDMLSSENLKDADILLLDISLENHSSLDSLPELSSRFPEMKILILSMHNKPILVKKAINLGISGWVLKNSPAETLIQAAEEIYRGRKYLDPEISDSLFSILSDKGNETETDSLYNSLSKREQQIFRMLAEGLASAQIAKQLFISRKTVDNHRSKILSKLKLESMVDLVKLADHIGVI